MFGLPNNQRGSTANSAAAPGSTRRGGGGGGGGARSQQGRTASPGPSQQPGGSLFGQKQATHRDSIFPGGQTAAQQQQQQRRQGGGGGGGGVGGGAGGAGGGGLHDDDVDEIGLSEDQIGEIHQAFQLFDQNHDNRIDYHELKVAVKALGFELEKPELLQILRSHGVLATGSPPVANTPASQLFITYEAFLEIMAQRILERDPDEEINRAFDLFTAGAQPGRGGEVKIGVDDLRRVARELGEVLEEQELRAMIEEFDIDNDGMISREEFMAICKGE